MTTPLYQNQTDVSLILDYPMDGDAAVVPTSLAYTVLDEDGGVIVARTPVTGNTPSANKVTIEVAADDNTVPEGAVRTARIVRVFFVKADASEVVLTSRYIVEVIDKLTLMENSFQSYERALLTRLDLPALEGWDAASEADQIAALVTAHDRMCRMSYRYKAGSDAVDMSTVLDADSDYYTYVTEMRFRTEQDFGAFSPGFQTALRRAQVYEANDILAGDPVADKRAQGIISETTGEAKMFFTNKPPVRFAVGRNALSVLGPYLFNRKRLARS